MKLFITLISLLSMIFGNDEAEIVFAGDAMMHQGQIDAARKKDGSYDFSEYFTDIQKYIELADYAVVNLETPVSAPPFSGYPCFNAPSEYLDALKESGFDLYLTANNHTLDRRDKGLINTIKALEERHLDHIGTYTNDSCRQAQTPLIKQINGIKIAFLNYTYGTNGISPGQDVIVDYIDSEKIAGDVKAAKENGAEIIFACIHWGNEYQLLPSSAQKNLAKYVHSLGVDAIIGSHPHVIQPFMFNDGCLTVYSLGNFISNMKTKDTRGGALVKVVVKRNDKGEVKIDRADYRLVFTEPSSPSHNFRLKWADESSDPRAKAFYKSALTVLEKHNVNVCEDVPR